MDPAQPLHKHVIINLHVTFCAMNMMRGSSPMWEVTLKYKYSVDVMIFKTIHPPLSGSSSRVPSQNLTITHYLHHSTAHLLYTLLPILLLSIHQIQTSLRTQSSLSRSTFLILSNLDTSSIHLTTLLLCKFKQLSQLLTMSRSLHTQYKYI